MVSIDVFIPSYRPDERLLEILERLERQSVRPRWIRIINTDQDEFGKMLKKQGLTPESLLQRHPSVRIEHIGTQDFDHGGTRNRGFRQCGDADYVLTMTQDALPADAGLVEELLSSLQGQEKMEGCVAVSYARQLPNEGASVEESLSRAFNYPEESCIKRLKDLPQLGIKTYFCSNVCAMYRMDVWRFLGGFPERAIFNEDMIYAAGALRQDFGICYAAKARVFHSHSYTAAQQFHRNFDLGVSQAMNPQVFSGISSEGEGLTYVKAVAVRMLREHRIRELAAFVLRCACKLSGFRLGRAYQKLPRAWVLAFTSNRAFWQQET